MNEKSNTHFPQPTHFLVKHHIFWYNLGFPNPLIVNQVKHLLIILSILLLSSPVIGQETGVLYLWDTSSGQVWKTFRDKDTQPKYKGQVENGDPNGQGTYTFNDGRKYVGNWIDGEQNGQGTLTSPNGDKYEGEWKDGLPNGKGGVHFLKREMGRRQVYKRTQGWGKTWSRDSNFT